MKWCHDTDYEEDRVPSRPGTSGANDEASFLICRQRKGSTMADINDIMNDNAQPMSWHPKDPKAQGDAERGYGNGSQQPWLNGESYDDFQLRTNPPKTND